MPINQPLQSIAPLIVLTIGSMSTVSLIQGILTVRDQAGTSSVIEIIAGVAGLALCLWVAFASRTVANDDNGDDEASDQVEDFDSLERSESSFVDDSETTDDSESTAGHIQVVA